MGTTQRPCRGWAQPCGRAACRSVGRCALGAALGVLGPRAPAYAAAIAWPCLLPPGGGTIARHLTTMAAGCRIPGGHAGPIRHGRPSSAAHVWWAGHGGLCSSFPALAATWGRRPNRAPGAAPPGGGLAAGRRGATPTTGGAAAAAVANPAPVQVRRSPQQAEGSRARQQALALRNSSVHPLRAWPQHPPGAPRVLPVLNSMTMLVAGAGWSTPAAG